MILYDTKYLQLKSTKSKNGNDWVYAHRPNASNVVVILPVLNGKNVLFLKEERPPMQAEGRAKYCIALPAGLVGDERINETVEDAIRAELLEETGLVADKIEIVANNIASSPGCVSETSVIAIARISDTTEAEIPVSDGGVIVDRILVEIDNIVEWLRLQEKEGCAVTASTYVALFYLFNSGGNL